MRFNRDVVIANWKLFPISRITAWNIAGIAIFVGSLRDHLYQWNNDAVVSQSVRWMRFLLVSALVCAGRILVQACLRCFHQLGSARCSLEKRYKFSLSFLLCFLFFYFHSSIFTYSYSKQYGSSVRQPCQFKVKQKNSRKREVTKWKEQNVSILKKVGWQHRGRDSNSCLLTHFCPAEHHKQSVPRSDRVWSAPGV